MSNPKKKNPETKEIKKVYEDIRTFVGKYSATGEGPKENIEQMDPSAASSLQDQMMDSFNLGKLTPEQFKARMQELTAARMIGIGKRG